MGTVVNFDQHKHAKEQRIVTQEKRAQEALMAASVEFRRLAEMRDDSNDSDGTVVWCSVEGSSNPDSFERALNGR